MFRYIMSRIAAMLITLFLIMSLSFIVVRLMPMSLFENPEVPLEIQKQLEDKFHLNDPLPVQYFYFISDIVTDLDFGVSVKLRPGLPVFGILINRLPPTILVNFLSLFISIPLGLIAGTVAALKRNTWVDHVISFFVVIFISVPSFVFASALQYFLAFKLEWFPTLYDTNAATLAQQLHSLVLPIIALALSPIATIARYLRGELIENISSEYLLLARTKGLTKVQSIVRHAFAYSHFQYPYRNDNGHNGWFSCYRKHLRNTRAGRLDGKVHHGRRPFPYRCMPDILFGDVIGHHIAGGSVLRPDRSPCARGR